MRDLFYEANLNRTTGNRVFPGRVILGDPGADRGGKGKSKRAKENMMAAKKNIVGEKSPWGQVLTRPVPNSRGNPQF